MQPPAEAAAYCPACLPLQVLTPQQHPVRHLVCSKCTNAVLPPDGAQHLLHGMLGIDPREQAGSPNARVRYGHPTAVQCPTCIAQLHQAQIDGIPLSLCPECGTAWASIGTLDALVHRSAAGGHPPVQPTMAPPAHPTMAPPSAHPTMAPPSAHPTMAPPSAHPTMAPPSAHPTMAPPAHPTMAPPAHPTMAPPAHPTMAPPSAPAVPSSDSRLRLPKPDPSSDFMGQVSGAYSLRGGDVDPLDYRASASASHRPHRPGTAGAHRRAKPKKRDGVLVGVGLFTFAMFALGAALVFVRWPVIESIDVTSSSLSSPPSAPLELEQLDPNEPMSPEPLAAMPFGGQTISWWQNRLDALGAGSDVELYRVTKARLEAMGFVVDGGPDAHRVRPTRRLYKFVADRGAR